MLTERMLDMWEECLEIVLVIVQPESIERSCSFPSTTCKRERPCLETGEEIHRVYRMLIFGLNLRS
jgi:hypothetical protein